MTRSILRPQRLAIAVLMAPAVSLGGAQLLAWLIGRVGLVSVAPVGVHTYVPLVTAMPLPVLMAVAAVGLVGAVVVALAWRPVRRGGAGQTGWQRAVLQLTMLGALAQVVLFAGQLVVVDEVQGVADGASALLIAFVLQVIVSALFAVGACLAGRSLAPPAAHLHPPIPAVAIASAGAHRGDQAHLVALAAYPRRGPPPLLLADQGI